MLTAAGKIWPKPASENLRAYDKIIHDSSGRLGLGDDGRSESLDLPLSQAREKKSLGYRANDNTVQTTTSDLTEKKNWLVLDNLPGRQA